MNKTRLIVLMLLMTAWLTTMAQGVINERGIRHRTI